jgi:hypothetical protein
MEKYLKWFLNWFSWIVQGLSAWNYLALTNAILNQCINIIRLIHEETLNPKLWTYFVFTNVSF